MFKKTNLLILNELELMSEEPLPQALSMVVASSGNEFLIQTVWETLTICGREYHNSSQQAVMTSKSLSQVAFKDCSSFSQSKSISILRSSFIFFIVIKTILSYLFIHLFIIYLPLKWEWQDNSEFT